jgi:hypothetical protein
LHATLGHPVDNLSQACYTSVLSILAYIYRCLLCLQILFELQGQGWKMHHCIISGYIFHNRFHNKILWLYGIKKTWQYLWIYGNILWLYASIQTSVRGDLYLASRLSFFQIQCNWTALCHEILATCKGQLIWMACFTFRVFNHVSFEHCENVPQFDLQMACA